jgi:diketogulonate reductase-like aldo/keto reductase
MIESIRDTIELANGVRMPRLGLGTYKSDEGGDVERAVQAALELGYRAIDTASFYGNEQGIGAALAASGVPRAEVFLTTKVWNEEQGYDTTLTACEQSLSRLGTDYLDLYLVHWPLEQTPETWRAMERLLDEGSVRAIGVCNHFIRHLDRLLQTATIVPMVDQYEFHPYLQQPDVLAYCREHDIVVEAWAPIMKGHVSEVPRLIEIGHRHGKSPAQVAIRWTLQQDLVTIPKSVHATRIAENADVFDFELTAEEMDEIRALDRDERFGPHPDRYPRR